MKTLIFSDTHLSSKFDEKKFNFLKEIISSADRVIINGDFWDNWLTDYNSFINSKWNELFPLLRERKTVCIFGNHDSREDCEDTIPPYCVKAVKIYSANIDGLDINIEPGDNILGPRKTGFLKFYYKLLDDSAKSLFGKILRMFIHSLENLAYFVSKDLIFRTSSIPKKSNKILKESKPVSKWLICGDTHGCELDKKNRFANTGYINHGYASYIWIEDGEISLVKSTY